MWTSTLAYWIATLFAALEIQAILYNATSQMLDSVSYIQGCFGLNAGVNTTSLNMCPKPTWPHPDDVRDSLSYIPAYNIQQCVGTTGLTLNVNTSRVARRVPSLTSCQVIIGDAIVWWRAWVILSNHRIILFIGITMTLVTMGM